MSDVRRRLPGDPPHETSVARMLRVDHAGEYGAAHPLGGAGVGDATATK